MKTLRFIHVLAFLSLMLLPSQAEEQAEPEIQYINEKKVTATFQYSLNSYLLEGQKQPMSQIRINLGEDSYPLTDLSAEFKAILCFSSYQGGALFYLASDEEEWINLCVAFLEDKQLIIHQLDDFELSSLYEGFAQAEDQSRFLLEFKNREGETLQHSRSVQAMR